MKKFFTIVSLVLFSCVAVAKERPSVGLVLSGGGARGGAHVGILKFLEEHRIPVDYIVGTSMGSFMGGMYASGYDADELQEFLTNTRWSEYIATDIPRKYIPFRRKILSAGFPGYLSVGINGANKVALPNGIFKRQFMLELLTKKFANVLRIKDFHHLPIPYAAVATDIATGEAVVLDSGNIAKSVYASICVPGGFEPITINGRVLVDGGISQNLPVETMRKLFHPDYIIVVDISTPFDKTKAFDSYEEVMSQQLDILTRKNVEDTIKSLRPNEILIEPKLDGYSFLDADKYPQIIQKGYEAARQAQSRIVFLSIGEQEYETYKKRHKTKPKTTSPIVEAIEIRNDTFVSNETIRSYITQPIGKPLDLKKLQKDLNSIYYLLYFAYVDFEVVQKEGKTTLVVFTKPSWNAHGDIRAGIEFEDDFNGHSDYQVRLEYNKYNLNPYGGEWRSRVEFGRVRMLKTELYQPLDIRRRFYLRSNAYIDKIKYYVAPNFVEGVDEAKNDQTIPIESDDIGAMLGFGVNIGDISRFETGIDIKRVEPSVDIFLKEGDDITFDTYSQKQRLSDIYVVAEIDSLDNPFFPKDGYKGYLKYYKVVDIVESGLEYSQLFGEISGVYTFGKATLVPKVKFGTTYNSQDLQDANDIAAFYNLGGLFNISGRTTYNKTGDNLYFASLNYRYLFMSNQFLSSLTSEAYIGASVEMGKAWYEKQDSASLKNALYGSSIYLGIDTVLGPFYFAYGFSDRRHQTVYFSLGKSY